MFHLFETVYVAPEWRCDILQPRIVISKSIGNNNTFDNIKRHKENGLSLIDVNYWNQVVGRQGIFNNDLAFFNYIVDRKKTYPKLKIYVDDEAWHTIFIKWIKLLFPNISFNTALILYNLTSTHIKHRQPSRDYSWTGPDKQSIIGRINNISKWDFKSSDDFIYMFNKIKLDLPPNKYSVFLSSIINDISVEWMVSNYLYDGSYEQQIGRKMFDIVKNTVHEESHNVRLIYINNLRQQWVQSAFGYQWDGTSDLNKIISQNRYLQYILDINYNPSDFEFSMRYPDIRLSYLFECVERASGLPQGLYAYFPHEIINYLNDNTSFSKRHIDMMIEFDRNNVNSLFDNNDMSKVNVIILKWLYEQPKNILEEMKLNGISL